MAAARVFWQQRSYLAAALLVWQQRLLSGSSTCVLAAALLTWQQVM
jgi:hypothetical protein